MATDNGATIEAVLADAEFHELVRRRTVFAWTLSAIMVVLYFGFILLVAFAPHVLGRPIAEGAVTTVGIPLGLLVILSAFALTGIYVRRANTVFDALTERIRSRVA